MLLGSAANVRHTPEVAGAVNSPDLRWVNASTLTVGGRGFNGTATFWNRLPAAAGLPAAGINGGVYGLSKDSAGMSVRFSTNATSIAVRYTLISANVDMWHMPSTGVSGADLYAFDATASEGGVAGAWRWIATCKVVAPSEKGALPTVNSILSFPHETRPAGFSGEVRYKLHLPTYNGIRDDVEIGVEAGASIPSPDPAASSEPRPIVWYGTSIAQGCCASRPGQIFTNQIARRLSPNRDVINLGFSGSGIMNLGVTKFITAIDAAMIVIDCNWNMNAAEITANMAPLVSYLRSNGHPTTPLVMVEGTTGGQQWISPTNRHTNQTANRLAFQAAYNAILAKTGDKHLHQVSGDALYHHPANSTTLEWEPTYEDPTVGGLHPTDLGHTRIAEFYQVFLPPLLAESDKRRGTGIVSLPSLFTDELREDTPELYESISLKDESDAQKHFATGETFDRGPDPVGYSYTDFRELGVHGRAFNETALGHYYSRLPASAQHDVTPAVWNLAMMSTNQYVRFVTNAPTVTFKYKTQLPCKGLWHMPTSGACYLDLYAFDQNVQSWRHVAPIAPTGDTPFYDLMSPTTGGLPSAHNGGQNVTYILYILWKVFLRLHFPAKSYALIQMTVVSTSYLPVRNSLIDDSGFVGVPTGSYLAGSAAAAPLAHGDSAPREAHLLSLHS